MLISIVIPTYNRFSVTCRSVDSCLKQTYPHIEVIVCDDRSDDGSYEKLSDHYNNEPRVTIIQNDGIKGANGARQCGVDQASGDAIAFLDSDDYLTPDSINDRIKILINNPKCILVYGNSKTGNRINKYDDISTFNRNRYLMRELSLCEYGTMMVRKSAFTDDGLIIDPLLKAWQDDDMILSVNKLFPDEDQAILHCNKVVLVHNRSEISITGNHHNLYDGLSSILQKYEPDIIHECGYSRMLLWKLRLKYRKLWIICTESKNPLMRIAAGTARRIIYIICRIGFKHIWG